MAPHTGRYTNDATADRGRTPAQWYCLLAGVALLLAGLFGFLADAGFRVGDVPSGTVEGDSFLGFEVNGWHNVVHLASGLVLLAAANTRATAKVVALGFGLVYGLVAIIGLIDGSDVLGILPVNTADNILHIALALLGILAGLVSKARKGHRHDADVGSTRDPALDRGVGTHAGEPVADRTRRVR
jgi:hypothetical protein